jgi:hypothetical protein
MTVRRCAECLCWIPETEGNTFHGWFGCNDERECYRRGADNVAMEPRDREIIDYEVPVK